MFAGNALGSAAVTLDGGELTGMVNEGVSNTLEMGGTGATIDAATGTTVDLSSGNWTLDTTSSPTLQFGSASRKGVVDWHTNNASIAEASSTSSTSPAALCGAEVINFDFLTGNSPPP